MLASALGVEVARTVVMVRAGIAVVTFAFQTVFAWGSGAFVAAGFALGITP